MAEFETILGDVRPPANIVVETGQMVGTTTPVSKHQIIIGRDAGMADVGIGDALASPRHARISWKGMEYVIEDLNSSSGTILNGESISTPHVLTSGDRINIGDSSMLFELQSSEAPTESVTSQPITETTAVPDNRDMIPSRLVLETATQINRRLGHENLGFLTESHGFLPTSLPLLNMPSGFEAWDEIAERMPELWRNVRVRQALRDLPVLDASEENLPDEYLLRASVIMSILAHSYHRISAEPPDAPMPEGVQLPWEQVSRRLDRLAPHLSYIDLMLYNWKLTDPDIDDPIRLENLELLVSTVDNQEEKVLYLMQVEAHYKIAPIIGAVVRAQEAVKRDDVEALKKELVFIADGIQYFGQNTFMYLNPNPHSDTFVDPVVWAKTVAPFAVPIVEGTVGPSGVSAPLFHMLDTFFGRHRYDSHLGKEMLNMREWYPKHWRDFFDSLGEISVGEYVKERNDSILSGIFKEAAMVYAGESGFLTRHKIKAYGYLDIAFKVGRSVTIGGFSGLFKDRVWDLAVDELMHSQVERENDLPSPTHHAPIKSVEITNTDGDKTKWVKRITFDVSQTGMRYLPGDRCAVLPENSDDLIDRTLTALQAKGYEEIALTAEWREAVNMRYGYENAETIPLRTLLQFGQIRPVDREVAKALHAVSLNSKLRRIVEARAEDQWELWDLITMLSQSGFDPKRLWKAIPGEQEYICQIVPPEKFRMYSISSTMDTASLSGADELNLTIGRLLYDTRDTDVSQAEDRFGTASRFLGDTTFSQPDDKGPVSLKLVHPPRFSLPEDPATPIVMFAGGTGIAPFRGFIRERANQENAGESWLFMGTRDRTEFYYQEEFEPIVAKGNLHVRPAFSRDAVDTTFVKDGDGGHFVFNPGEKRYIGDEILRDENAVVLWNMLKSKKDGGQGAYFYVCGRTGFASSVTDAIKSVLRRYSPGTSEEKEEAVNKALYRLVGEERYLQDIFTTYTGSHIDNMKVYSASEIVLHNNYEDGFWLVVDGRVYDMNEFGHLHPGGFKIIHAYAGMDGTQAYEKVQHHINPEVDSMLGMYELGVVRRIDFGMEWGVVVGPDGLRYMALADIYRAWIRFLYNVVEMENALYNDYTVKEQTIVADDPPDSYPPIKLQYLLEAHDRFLINYVTGTTGEDLENLWAVTSGICSQAQDVRWVQNEFVRISQGQQADTVKQVSKELQKQINDIIERNPDDDDPTIKLVKAYCDLLETEDKRYLHDVKMALREGVLAFEEYERDTARLGSDRLIAALEQIPRVLEDYYSRVLSGVLTNFFYPP